MKKTGFIAILLCTLFACGDKNTPDVSDIKVTSQAERFDQDFFALDTEPPDAFPATAIEECTPIS